MNNLIFILADIAVIVTLIGIILSMKKEIKDKEKRINALKEETEKAHYNLDKMLEYFDKLLEINADEKKTRSKIENAKNEEDIFAIVSDIVNANNARVQEHSAE